MWQLIANSMNTRTQQARPISTTPQLHQKAHGSWW